MANVKTLNKILFVNWICFTKIQKTKIIETGRQILGKISNKSGDFIPKHNWI